MLLPEKTIGIKIAKERKTAKLTQAELAEKIDISEKYLSRIECGKQIPSIIIVVKICEALHISADELLNIPQRFPLDGREELHNYLACFSKYEQKKIIEIIKIIKEIIE